MRCEKINQRGLTSTVRNGNELVGGGLASAATGSGLQRIGLSATVAPLSEVAQFLVGTRQEFGEEPEFTTPDGRRVVRRHKIVSRDRLNQVQQVEILYYVTHSDGRLERLVHSFPMRYLYRFEAEHLLARSGFEVQSVYSGYDKSPYGSNYPGELIFVAKKI